MKLAAIKVDTKEQGRSVKVKINHTYMVKHKNDIITYNKETSIDIKKPTKKDIIKSVI